MENTERRVRAAEDRLTRLDGEGAGELVMVVAYTDEDGRPWLRFDTPTAAVHLPDNGRDEMPAEPDFLGTCPDGRRLRVVHPR